MRKLCGKKREKTPLQVDLESRYATAITASVNALFRSFVLAFNPFTLNASAASHASHPYRSGEGAIALLLNLVSFPLSFTSLFWSVNFTNYVIILGIHSYC